MKAEILLLFILTAAVTVFTFSSSLFSYGESFEKGKNESLSSGA